MKSFYGGTYIGKEVLAKNNIYHPIRLEYYKTEETYNSSISYGIEIIKTEYTDDKVNIENNRINNITNEEKQIEKILEKLKQGMVTPWVLEEILKEMLTA